MPIRKLDHVNVRTTQLDAMIEWYVSVLGLQQGPRPDFNFPGAWMYAGDAAVVHLVGVDDTQMVGSEARLKVEHFAFSASDEAEFQNRLTRMSCKFRRVKVADMNTVAFNIWDPDGNHIHVDFPAQV